MQTNVTAFFAAQKKGKTKALLQGDKLSIQEALAEIQSRIVIINEAIADKKVQEARSEDKQANASDDFDLGLSGDLIAGSVLWGGIAAMFSGVAEQAGLFNFDTATVFTTASTAAAVAEGIAMVAQEEADAFNAAAKKRKGGDYPEGRRIVKILANDNARRAFNGKGRHAGASMGEMSRERQELGRLSGRLNAMVRNGIKTLEMNRHADVASAAYAFTAGGNVFGR